MKFEKTDNHHNPEQQSHADISISCKITNKLLYMGDTSKA